MDKIKIKDAAAEQKMEPRAFLNGLKEWGIVDKDKTLGGSITAEEYDRYKTRKAESEAPRKVIIRRNRNAGRNAVPAEAAAPEAVRKEKTAQAEEKASAVPADPESTAEILQKEAVETAQDSAEEKDQQEKAVQPKGAGRPEKTRRKKTVEIPPARIIQQPVRQAAVEERPKAVQQTPPAAVLARQEQADQPARQPAEEKETSEAPVVQFQAETEKKKEPQVESAALQADDKPVQSVAEELQPQPDKKVREAAKPEKTKRTPAVSADPDGTTRAGKKQVSGENSADIEGRKKQQAAPEAPRVRVISRPDAPQVRIVRPADGSRPQRDGTRRDGTGRFDERNRSPRPDTRDGRDARPVRDGRDAGTGRGVDGRRPSSGTKSRPSGQRTGSGGAPFSPSFVQQPPMENEQSRKKRNKGRRNTEFSDGGEDFSRRRNVSVSIIPDMDDEDGVVRTRSRSHKPKKQQTQSPAPSTQPMKAAKRRLRVEESIRVADMAHQMGVKSSEIIKILFGLGVMATINMALDIDTATLVASEFGYEVEKVGFSEEALLPSAADTPEMLKPRPPVVTIMGHVDHGKTSLLDAIRKTSVTSGEAGGITQHIGAYHVKTKRGDIVFLDTPGHAAFTAMRARGAQVTDLVVLVVAADDGVMDQTREAINHSRAAGVPILVAVNKIDKETANPDRVLRELSELGLQPEAWGGDTVVGMVSAKTGKGLDELLELIALQAEILELKANPDKPARGHVVEAKLDKGRGPVATVLVQEGTIHQGDVFVCGVFSGRVRALFNDQGRKIKQAGPSMPVEVQGFEGVPEAGEEFVCLEDEKTARRIAESRAAKLREKELAKVSRVTLENFLRQSADTQETLVLNVVLKADVQGSLEAITESLKKLSTDKVRIEIIHGGAGAISESDVMLATASNAIIIGFNVRPTAKVKEVAEQEHVDIRFYDIIYKLVDEVKSAMAGLLAPVSKEVYLGQAEVRKTFSLPKIGVIAGCMVVDGKLTRTANVRLLRDGVVVYTGKIASLKRLKDDAREVVRNFECGVGLENFHDIKAGDVIEAFDMVKEAATLD
ncbi:MAG: translation initiation factor IF-2 [Mailhella sp.]|nr:translation initiation factor IF-2 [Mailhella sp.]